jgi:adenine-specific DNA-methyltransferase
MAGMFSENFPEKVSTLDAGAAVGSLTGALLDRILQSKNRINSVTATTYEVDSLLNDYLKDNLEKYRTFFDQKEINFSCLQQIGDFIRGTIPQFVLDRKHLFTHAILNPPYKKINSGSDHRKLLRLINFETVNLYAAFVGIAINLLKSGGELVAIIPRSFCNGNYYKGFRELIIKNCAIKHLHLFESRTHAFHEDDVLQENIIIHLIKGQQQGEVHVSRSEDSFFNDMKESNFDFSSIVRPNDTELFFHVPDLDGHGLHATFNQTLKDLNLFVSTGPVVDFRAKEAISMEVKEGYVPLLYAVHFNGKEIEWPKETKKPNSIKLDDSTRKMMYPNGFYTVVKRFSPKEEKQRIVARVINPNKLNFDYIGIENHLNVFHAGKVGMTEDQAFGIAAYLNSSVIDKYFRTFNGHTQVNATDLKQLPYPSIKNIETLGKWAKKQKTFDQAKIDSQIAKLYEQD